MSVLKKKYVSVSLQCVASVIICFILAIVLWKNKTLIIRNNSQEVIHNTKHFVSEEFSFRMYYEKGMRQHTENVETILNTDPRILYYFEYSNAMPYPLKKTGSVTIYDIPVEQFIDEKKRISPEFFLNSTIQGTPDTQYTHEYVDMYGTDAVRLCSRYVGTVDELPTGGSWGACQDIVAYGQYTYIIHHPYMHSSTKNPPFEFIW